MSEAVRGCIRRALHASSLSPYASARIWTGCSGVFPGALPDLQPRERAVGRHPVRPLGRRRREDGPADLHGQMEVLGLHAPGPVDAPCTARSSPPRCPGSAREVPRLEPDVLDLEVARHLVGDAARRRWKSVSSRPASCRRMRYSQRSRVCAATELRVLRASGQDRILLACSMRLHVGPGDTTVVARPAGGSSEVLTLSASGTLGAVEVAARRETACRSSAAPGTTTLARRSSRAPRPRRARSAGSLYVDRAGDEQRHPVAAPARARTARSAAAANHHCERLATHTAAGYGPGGRRASSP